MFARRGVLAFLLLFGLVGLAVLFAALRLSAPSRMGSRPTVLTFGVTPNFEHVGLYKSAVESYTHTGMTPPAREAMEAILDEYYRLLVDSLATARGLSRQAVTQLIDQGPFTAQAARSRGLVDTLLY